MHSGYTFMVSICVSWESNPQPFALLTQCSEPQEHTLYYFLSINVFYNFISLWSALAQRWFNSYMAYTIKNWKDAEMVNISIDILLAQSIEHTVLLSNEIWCWVYRLSYKPALLQQHLQGLSKASKHSFRIWFDIFVVCAWINVM